jgi:hypothetical protein
MGDTYDAVAEAESDRAQQRLLLAALGGDQLPDGRQKLRSLQWRPRGSTMHGCRLEAVQMVCAVAVDGS